MGVESQIADLAEPGATAVGLVVDGVEVSSAGSRSRVLVTLDLPETEVGSADLEAIARASRAIGKALDDAGVPKGPYTLEVSTPGTSRPLTERRHFMRARTRLVNLVGADGVVAHGRLAAVDDDGLTLAAEDGSKTTVAWDAFDHGAVQVELKKQ